jgi:sec-independent protein translocase protein TatA
MGRTFFVGEIVGPDILIILAIVMLLFGSTKIPKLARSLGQASYEFRKGVSGADGDPPSAPSIPAPAPTGQVQPPTNGATPQAETGPGAGASTTLT